MGLFGSSKKRTVPSSASQPLPPSFSSTSSSSPSTQPTNPIISLPTLATTTSNNISQPEQVKLVTHALNRHGKVVVKNANLGNISDDGSTKRPTAVVNIMVPPLSSNSSAANANTNGNPTQEVKPPRYYQHKENMAAVQQAMAAVQQAMAAVNTTNNAKKEGQPLPSFESSVRNQGRVQRKSVVIDRKEQHLANRVRYLNVQSDNLPPAAVPTIRSQPSKTVFTEEKDKERAENEEVPSANNDNNGSTAPTHHLKSQKSSNILPNDSSVVDLSDALQKADNVQRTLTSIKAYLNRPNPDYSKLLKKGLINTILVVAMSGDSGRTNRINALQILAELSCEDEALDILLQCGTVKATLTICQSEDEGSDVMYYGPIVKVHRNLVTSSKPVAMMCLKEGVVDVVKSSFRAILTDSSNPTIKAQNLMAAEENNPYFVTSLDCMVICAELAIHGAKVQNMLVKAELLPLLVQMANLSVFASSEKHQLHIISAMADFSTEARWHHDLVKSGALLLAIGALPSSKDPVVLAEASRILGNIASTQSGRMVVYKAGGLHAVCKRAHSFCSKYKDAEWQSELVPLLDFILAVKNMCIDIRLCAEVIESGGLSVLVSSCEIIEDPKDLRKNEAFGTLVQICKSKEKCKAKVLDYILAQAKQRASPANLNELHSLLTLECNRDSTDLQALAVLNTRQHMDFQPSGKMLAIEKDENDDGATTSAELVVNNAPAGVVASVVAEKNVAPAAVNKESFVGDNGKSRKETANKLVVHAAHIPRGSVSHRDNALFLQLKDYLHKKELANVSNPLQAKAEKPSASSPHEALEDLLESEVFELGQELGRGGYGVVYLAKNLRNGELVAIKQFHRTTNTTACDCKAEGRDEHHPLCGVDRKAFTELRIWKGLCHKNVVKYQGCFVGEQNDLNLVVEYVDGWSLAEHLARFEAFPESLVAEITRQVLDGLEYLHGHGVTHRDLKPANIMVSQSGAVKITDFGVSCASYAQTLASGNTMVGTPWYIAPEITQGKIYSSAVDIFSLGCTVLELATGKRPYHDLPAMQALFKMVEQRHPPIPDTLSTECKNFLKLCWEHDPMRRPTARQLKKHPFIMQRGAESAEAPTNAKSQ